MELYLAEILTKFTPFQLKEPIFLITR